MRRREEDDARDRQDQRIAVQLCRSRGSHPRAPPAAEGEQIVNDALASLDAEFDRLYAAEGRPSIAPERLVRASLIQILFSVRSERQLMEQMRYNLLFRWFVGLGIDDPVWVPTVFTKNRDRLLTTEMSRKFLAAILAHREVAPLLSDEHFSVDGTLIKAWASMKSFQPKTTDAPPDGDGPDDPPAAPHPIPIPQSRPPRDRAGPPQMTRAGRRDRNAEVDFRGEKRSNANPCLDHRSGRAALPEVTRHRRHALLHGPYPDGEPQRPDRAGRDDPSGRPCRTAGGTRHGPSPFPRIDP